MAGERCSIHALIISPDETVAQSVSDKLAENGFSSVYDDRSTQMGVLLASSRRLGMPLTVIAGRSYKESGQLELQGRDGREAFAGLEQLGGVAAELLVTA